MKYTLWIVAFLLCCATSLLGQARTQSVVASPALSNAFESACKRDVDTDRYTLIQAPPVVFPRMKAVLEWERGSGHGGTLELYRAEWRAEQLVVTRLALEPDRKRYSTPYPLDDATANLATTLIPESRATEVLDLVAQALALRLEEKELDPASGGRYSFSTANFHSSISLKVDGAVASSQSFAGYPSNDDQPRYLSTRVAGSVLSEVLRDAEWLPVPVGELELSRLAERIELISADTWWVTERLLQIVGAVGDERFLPFLRARIVAEVPEDKRSNNRPLYYAINAYARISNTDLRPARPETMDANVVRAAYLKTFANAERR